MLDPGPIASGFNCVDTCTVVFTVKAPFITDTFGTAPVSVLNSQSP